MYSKHQWQQKQGGEASAQSDWRSGGGVSMAAMANISGVSEKAWRRRQSQAVSNDGAGGGIISEIISKKWRMQQHIAASALLKAWQSAKAMAYQMWPYEPILHNASAYLISEASSWHGGSGETSKNQRQWQ